MLVDEYIRARGVLCLFCYYRLLLTLSRPVGTCILSAENELKELLRYKR